MNTTHMHLYTHTKPESRGQAGLWQSAYHDTMIDHDRNVGQVLDCLDELGIADDTIVVYSTDNGPHRNSWPDAGTTPFRSEKDTNWEGAFRVPEMIRWPGKIEAGTVSNEIIQHHDWLPTFLAAAGEPDIIEKLKKGHKAGADGDTEYKVHIDGFNLLPYLTGEVETSPRRGFFYFSDDGDLVAMRFENWKVVFMEQRCQGTLRIWAEPFTTAAGAHAVQPAHRPLRVRRHHVEHVLRLVPAPRLLHLLHDRDGDDVPRHVQGVPAATRTRQLQRRPGRRKAPSIPSEGLKMPDKKPNILVIWGDDIGISNLSCYSRGMMGYFTPNIDRIADEGMLFTDSYGEQSCTAGRSSFITGQSVYRTGMSKVGMPGVDIGLQKEDPTIAELLKPLGYATGQFGKNHLGDLNKYLPTAHGFDEFFGNLYHLNAEEEPENADYPPRRRRRCCAGRCCPAASSTPGRPTRTPARSTSATDRSASNASRTPDR